MRSNSSSGGQRQEKPDRARQLPFQELLENNDLGIIENPLMRVEESELDEDVLNFYEEHSLALVTDLDTLTHGAHLARDEEATIAEGILSDVEKEALMREKTTRIWEESKELKVILLTCCVGSIVQGWAQGAIVGANTGWPAEFGLEIGSGYQGQPRGRTSDIWIFSATNAIVYCKCEVLS